MKKAFLISAALVLVFVGTGLYLISGGAYGRIVVPGPSHRFGTAVGRAYYARDPSSAIDVNLESLMPYLRDADWTSDHWSLWKMPYVVEFSDGLKMKIDRLGGHYTIDGVPGVFSVTDLTHDQQERFSAGLNSLLQEWPNKPLQGTEGKVPSSSTKPEALRP